MTSEETSKITGNLSGSFIVVAGKEFYLRNSHMSDLEIKNSRFEIGHFIPGPEGIAGIWARAGELLMETDRIDKNPDQVNIIGADITTIGRQEKLAHGLEHLKKRNLDPVFIGGSGYERAESFRKAPRGILNWVVSAAGIPLAENMKQKYGIPYLTGIPVGKYAMLTFRKQVNVLTGRDDEEIEAPVKTLVQKESPVVMVTGEPLLALTIRNCLRDDFGLRNVIPAVYASDEQIENFIRNLFPDEKLCFFRNAGEFWKTEREADCLVADPVYRKFMENPEKLKAEIPDPFVSEDRNLDIPYMIFGKKGQAFLKEKLCLN